MARAEQSHVPRSAKHADAKQRPEVTRLSAESAAIQSSVLEPVRSPVEVPRVGKQTSEPQNLDTSTSYQASPSLITAAFVKKSQHNQHLELKSGLLVPNNKKLGQSFVPVGALNMSIGFGHDDRQTPMTGKHIIFNKTMDSQQHLQALRDYQQRVPSQKASNISKTQFDARQSTHQRQDTISDL